MKGLTTEEKGEEQVFIRLSAVMMRRFPPFLVVANRGCIVQMYKSGSCSSFLPLILSFGCFVDVICPWFLKTTRKLGCRDRILHACIPDERARIHVTCDAEIRALWTGTLFSGRNENNSARADVVEKPAVTPEAGIDGVSLPAWQA